MSNGDQILLLQKVRICGVTCAIAIVFFVSLAHRRKSQIQ